MMYTIAEFDERKEELMNRFFETDDESYLRDLIRWFGANGWKRKCKTKKPVTAITDKRNILTR